MRLQAFIPVVTEVGRIVSIVAIPLTDFSSSPTTIVLGGRTFPLEERLMRRTRVLGAGVTSYFGIPTTESAVRRGGAGVPGAAEVSNLFPRGHEVVIRGMIVQPSNVLDWFSNFFVMGAPLLPSGGLVVAPPPTPTGDQMEWDIGSILTTATGCTYFDIDWVSTYKDNSSSQPVSVSVIPPADPVISSTVKVFLVQTVEGVTIAGPDPQTTLRFVKINANPLPPGTFTYVAQVTNSDGSMTTVNINLEVSP